MEKRLIDANRIICEVESNVHMLGCHKRAIMSALENAPTIDAAEVVRCEECELHEQCTTEIAFIISGLSKSKRFCGAGKRKAGTK